MIKIIHRDWREDDYAYGFAYANTLVSTPKYNLVVYSYVSKLASMNLESFEPINKISFSTIISFAKVLKEGDRLDYLLKNNWHDEILVGNTEEVVQNISGNLEEAQFDQSVFNLYHKSVIDELIDNLNWGWTPVIFETKYSGYDIGQFKKISIPLVRKIYPTLVMNKIVSVQPMTQPSSLIYYLRHRYSSTSSGI